MATPEPAPAEPLRWWEEERVDWEDLDERKRVLGGWRDALGPPSEPEPRWFVADGPEVGGLQLVVRRDHERTPEDPVPALLEDPWYPGGVVPPCLPALLGIGTSRVVEPGRSARELVAEAMAIVVGLVPAGERSTTIARTTDWLARVAERTGAPPSSSAPAEDAAASWAAPSADDVEPDGRPYAGWRVALAGHAERVAAGAGLAPDEARDRIVARLVHATNVLGRLASDDLRHEAALLTAAAALLPDG